MSGLAVRVENLGKQYQIGELRGPTLLREVVGDWSRGVVRRKSRALRRGAEPGGPKSIWALRHIDLELAHGETFGVIGRNGAGKSTLLKILSRITEPTEGEAWIHGRVGSLLEVGTGFHPELTGRENTYLNGAILGMKRREIDAKFDDIVAFAEIEQFVDTPVKRYSSGMYLRLAFAVAAHLEPEILIVDEVLAVGDASFQRKCIGKMADVAREGRTVLFVSHNMAAVQSLCSTAALLRAGTLSKVGPVRDVVGEYLRSIEAPAAQRLCERTDRRGRGEFRLSDILIATDAGAPAGVLVTGWPARFTFHLDSFRAGLSVWFTIYDQQGQPVSSFHSHVHSSRDERDSGLRRALVCEIPDLPLVPGLYRVNAAVYTDHDLQDHIEGAAIFEVIEGALHGRPVSAGSGAGSVRLNHRWIHPLDRGHG